jgi:hypothetical protein
LRNAVSLITPAATRISPNNLRFAMAGHSLNILVIPK